MANTKKIIILNGINDFNGKAVAKIETNTEYITARVEVLNSTNLNCKNFNLLIGVDDKILTVTVDKKAIFETKFIGFCSILNGVSVLIKGNHTPLFYGESGNPNYKLNDLIKEINDNNLSDNFESASYKNEYDDEVIATENYYEKTKNEHLLFTKNDGEFKDDKKQENDTEKEDDAFKNEESEGSFKSQEFYLKNKGKLDEIFLSYEPFYAYNSIIPNSKFALIKYSENDHYIVGIILENNAVKYICYGVPKKSENLPKNIEKYCKFVPTSIDLKSGYYLVFQSADSGKII